MRLAIFLVVLVISFTSFALSELCDVCGKVWHDVIKAHPLVSASNLSPVDVPRTNAMLMEVH